DRAIAQAAGAADEAALPHLVGALEIEIYQAQVVVQEQVLEAITTLFNALGASALSRKLGWDRFWRNARAISSHNPVIYKERLIGDHAINGT
ncbi:monooxygenase, partial [Acinetobacter baumannii]